MPWMQEIEELGSKKQVIYLFMTGAMSHVDTFDPKPGSKVQGDTKVINTKTPGIKFGEHMQKLAGFSNDLAVLRGMSQETAAHGPGIRCEPAIKKSPRLRTRH